MECLSHSSHRLLCKTKLNCRELRCTNSSEVTSDLFHTFEVFVWRVCSLREFWTWGVKVLGSVQNFYNHRNALFNTLKIDQVRRLPCFGHSGALHWRSTRVATAWFSTRSLSVVKPLQVLMSSMPIATSLHFRRCHVQMSVAPFSLPAYLHLHSRLQSLCFDTSWPSILTALRLHRIMCSNNLGG